MLIDLHVHTHLSDDSRTIPEKYLERAANTASGLGAICFTEHRSFPTDAETDRLYAELTDRYGILVIKGLEADTDLGHLLLFGLTPAALRHFDPAQRMLKSDHLIEVIYSEGGIAIPAHPFRDSGFGTVLEELTAKHGTALGAIEVLNGQNSARENELAEVAAQKFDLTALGASDAHFPTPQWFLTYATELERDIKNAEELCAEIRARRAKPYRFRAFA